MDEQKRPKLRISILTSGLMVTVALIYDGTQVLIELITFGFGGWIINPIINIWSLMTFYTWFKLNGVSYNKPGKILTLGVPGLMEMIPFLSDLPTWTAGVIMNLAQVNAEDLLAKVSPVGVKALGSALTKKPKFKSATTI